MSAKKKFSVVSSTDIHHNQHPLQKQKNCFYLPESGGSIVDAV